MDTSSSHEEESPISSGHQQLKKSRTEVADAESNTTNSGELNESIEIADDCFALYTCYYLTWHVVSASIHALGCLDHWRTNTNRNLFFHSFTDGNI